MGKKCLPITRGIFAPYYCLFYLYMETQKVPYFITCNWKKASARMRVKKWEQIISYEFETKWLPLPAAVYIIQQYFDILVIFRFHSHVWMCIVCVTVYLSCSAQEYDTCRELRNLYGVLTLPIIALGKKLFRCIVLTAKANSRFPAAKQECYLFLFKLKRNNFQRIQCDFKRFLSYQGIAHE